MKVFKFIMALLIGSVLFFTACKNDPSFTNLDDTLNSIPNDGSVASVTAIDINNLMKKMDFDYVKNLEVYQDIIKEAKKENEVIAKVLSDPRTSGIDLTKNIYMATSVDDKKLGEVFNYMSASVSDVKALETLIASTDAGSIKEMEGYKMIEMGSKGVVAWNDDMAIAGSSIGYMDIPALVTKIFNTSENDSISENSDLQKSLSGNHDISSWINSNAYANNPDVKMGSGMANIDPEDLKDNFIHSHLDFEDGIVEGKSNFFLQKGLTKDLDLFFKNEVKTDFSNLTPSDGLVFQMSAALDTKGIKQVLMERAELKSFGNFAIRKYGLSIDDILKAFGGDLSVAGYASEHKDANDGLFMTNIGDKEKFDQLVDAGVDFGILTKTGDNLYALDKQMSRSISNGKMDSGKLFVKDDVAYISSNEVMTDAILSGNFKSNSGLGSKTSSLMKDNIFSTIVDFQTIKKYTKDMEDFEGTELQMSANRKKADMQFKLEDKKTNSLKQIFDMINESYLKDNKKKSRSI